MEASNLEIKPLAGTVAFICNIPTLVTVQPAVNRGSCFDTSGKWSQSSCRDALRADSDTRGRLQPTPSEERQRWHYDTLSSPHRPPPALFLRDDCWPPGAVGGWAPPPLLPGPQDLPRDYGPDGAAGGLSRSTPRRADDTTTRPSGAGRRVSPTTGTRSQTTCYVRRGTGRVVHC